MVSPVNRRFHDENGNRITPGRKLGEGGEGTVFLVDGQPGSVLKIWHPGRTPPDAESKLSHLVRNPVRPDLEASWHVTWPQCLIRENGQGRELRIDDRGRSRSQLPADTSPLPLLAPILTIPFNRGVPISRPSRASM